MKMCIHTAAALLLVLGLACTALADSPWGKRAAPVWYGEEEIEAQPAPAPGIPPGQLPGARPARMAPQAVPYVAAEEEAACPDCGCSFCQCRGPRWTATADALALWRSPARRHQLMVPLRGFPGVTYDVADMDLGWNVGERLSVIRHGNGCWDVEVLGFAMNGWLGIRDFPGMLENAPIPPGSGAILMYSPTLRYYSSLYDVEINFRRPVSKWLVPFIGFRWMELHEEFRIDSPYSFGPAAPANIMFNADNHMYGLQLGAEGIIWKTMEGVFRIDGLVKAAVFGNTADQNSVLSFPDVPYTGGVAASGGSTPVLAECGLTGVWQVTDHVAVRGGYQVMWLEGVALAPDQIRFTDYDRAVPTTTLYTGGSLFYHGAHCGVEVKW